MVHILSGAFLLSLLHAFIPNHWIPIVAIARGEGWSRGETVGVTLIAGGAHIVGTILVGVVVGLVGIGLTSSHHLYMRAASPVILVLIGLVFLWMDREGGRPHRHGDIDLQDADRRSRAAIITSLSMAMFLSPCFEIEALYFTAGTYGWPAIFGVSLIYLVVTLGGMLSLVLLGSSGLERVKWPYLEHHAKRVTGYILIVLGVLAYLVYSA